MATDGISMQWSQQIVDDDLVSLVEAAACRSAADSVLVVKSFTLV